MTVQIALTILDNPIIFIIILLLLNITTYSYFSLYRKKKNPKYPILPQEQSAYLSKDPINFFKILPLIPLRMWKIIFEKHKDKELNNAAKKVRFLIFVFIVLAILEIILPILTTPNLN